MSLRLDANKSREQAGLGERHGVAMGVITVLSTATQFRSAGSVGLGEILLILFILLTSKISLVQVSRQVSSPINSFVIAWLSLSTIGLLFKWLSSGSLTSSTIIALGSPTLLLVVTTYVATRPSPERLLRPWAKTFGWGLLGSQAVLLVCSRVTTGFGSIEFLFENVRFQGWTSNPNQLAFLTLVACFSVLLSLPKNRLQTCVAIVLTMAIGLSTGSDSFKVGLVVGSFALILSWILPSQSRYTSWQRVAGVAALSVTFLGTAWNWSQLKKLLKGVYESGDQGYFRVGLWKSCVDQILMSPLTGYGPGGHALAPGTSLQMECHNTILDLTIAGGVVLSGFALILFSKLAVDARSRRHVVSLMAIVSLLTMAMFGFVFRYPAFWLLVCLIETLTRKPDSDSSNYPISR